MIRFVVSKSDDHYKGFVLEGHAGYAEEGYDIICSAVSALAINTVNSIEVFTEDGFNAEQAEDGGYLKFMLTEEPSASTVLLLDSLVLGMQYIQEAYGEEYLSVSIPQESSKSNT